MPCGYGLFNAHANGGDIAFFAHVGGFIFGLLAARLLARAGQAAPGSNGAPRGSAAASPGRKKKEDAGDGDAHRSPITYSQY
jgi:hypothetical protein